jgi:hypothetical protein
VAARGAVAEPAENEAENGTEHDAGQHQHDAVDLSGREQRHQHADEQAPPGAAPRTRGNRAALGEAARHAFDELQVAPHDRHVLDGELLVGEVVDSSLRLGIRRVGAHRQPGRWFGEWQRHGSPSFSALLVHLCLP